MQVELHQSLLSGPKTDTLSLLAICAFGLHGRHRVIPDDRAVWDIWAQQFPVAVTEELLLTWEMGETAGSAGPARLPVRVTRTPKSDLQGLPIVVTPVVALAVLGRPLRVILENGRNDRAFLLAFCDSATRAHLVTAESEGWLVFDTAGGIGELRVRLESTVDRLHEASAQADAVRAFYLCDSDAREPGVLSTDADEVQRSLNQLHNAFSRQRPVHGARSGWLGNVLKRRAAENYASPSDILRWATKRHAGANALIEQAKSPRGRATLQIGAGAPNTSRRHLVAAIALGQLSDEIRSVICMKQGRGSTSAPRTSQNIWNKLDAFQAAALQDGFGSNFAASFYGTVQNLKESTGEIAEVLRTIVERL